MEENVPIRRKKLTEEQALEILRSTDPQRVIAKRYNIQQPMVSDIKSGRRWGHLQPGKTYTPKSRVKGNPELVTDDQIRKYDPMIKKMINDHVLRYWAGGNSCSTLDPRASIGRLGKSVEDLIQDGRIFVLQQLRWIQKNLRHGEGCAKESTLVYIHLRRKFISLSRSYTAARHGGHVVDIDGYRNTIQNLIDSISPGMPIDEAIGKFHEALGGMNKDLKRTLQSKVLDPSGAVKVRSSEELSSLLRNRLTDINLTTHVSFDDVADTAIDLMNPEIYAIVSEELANSGLVFTSKSSRSVPRVRARGRASKFRIFQLAREKGLPSTHGTLAAYLGRSVSAFSNILHNNSNGTPEFRRLLLDLFGEPLEELRRKIA